MVTARPAPSRATSATPRFISRPGPSAISAGSAMAAAATASRRLRGDTASFTAALRSLVNNPQFSDVKFIVGKEKQEICAHRCVLAARCSMFHAMFKQPVQSPDASQDQEPAQVSIILGDVEPEVFLPLIEFLYTNSVTLNSLILCVEFIKETLTAEQACEALQAAVIYRQGDMKNHCLAFIESHTQEVIRTRSFRELSAPALLCVLQSDRLTVDEVQLIRAVREWAHVNSVVLDIPVLQIAADIVGEIRLFLLSPDELTTLEKENRKDQFIPVERIAEAWKFHALKKGSRVQSHLFRRRKGTHPRDHHRYLGLHYK
ncbi:BTB/POZ domain-containing protein 19-like isoform X2 [Rhinatrema bivittatum]|uniref:BTB/POZ domain-containing protein 19-like isoform X2 n=1 Tax=Rhinatrema bivittatum TaxID=194408 RepID=UPI00112D287B|nr:BTB/POZ domain-containing protein 19-like isoform X2 [Rhinatrema bivittatum]